MTAPVSGNCNPVRIAMFVMLMASPTTWMHMNPKLRSLRVPFPKRIQQLWSPNINQGICSSILEN